jgi:hypothetical protein
VVGDAPVFDGPGGAGVDPDGAADDEDDPPAGSGVASSPHF